MKTIPRSRPHGKLMRPQRSSPKRVRATVGNYGIIPDRGALKAVFPAGSRIVILSEKEVRELDRCKRLWLAHRKAMLALDPIADDPKRTPSHG